jgi:hypothetical protein
VRELREVRRKIRERKAKEEHERLLNEIVGAAYRKAEREQAAKQRPRLLGVVAAYLKLFAKERRNDCSAEAITAAINKPEHYPLELITELLAELEASGDYDRILAEG